MTCKAELHPERAVKYDYCTAPECQEKNLRGLTMVAIGMNKAADELMILDDRTEADLASGKYRDQRRGTFGPTPPAAAPAARLARSRPRAQAPAAGRSGGRPPAQQQRRWTRSQERLALLYNEQGLRPAEIAARLGVSSHLATQIILAAKNRGKA